MRPKNIKIAEILGEFNEECVDHNMLFMIMTESSKFVEFTLVHFMKSSSKSREFI